MKGLIKIILLVYICIISMGCSNEQSKINQENQKESNIITISFQQEIKKVFVRDGRTGETYTVNNKSDLAELVDIIEGASLQERGETEDSTGYIYSITFSSDEDLLEIINSDYIIYEGKDYMLVDSNRYTILKAYLSEYISK